MSLAIGQTLTAIGPNLTASFLATGGVAPYVYSVIPGGAGGSIDSSTGLYTAPATVPSNPAQLNDTIQVTDSTSATATTSILVGNPLLLFSDIIQNQLGLDSNHCYLWDQKIFQPTDSGLYVAISVIRCKPFANVNEHASGDSNQYLSMYAVLDIDIISRGPAARDRKEEVLLALNSDYSELQQEANSFSIGRLAAGGQFINLSNIDGSAIPYRYKISVAMQYAYIKSTATPYFDTFENVEVTTEP